MASIIPNLTKKKLVDGTLDLDIATADSYRMLLHTSALAPNVDTWAFRSDLTNEVTGAGYTAGGKALTGVAINTDLVNDRAEWTFAVLVWPAATITARYGSIVRWRGGAATADEIIAILDFGSDRASTAADFTVTPNVEGVIQIA